MEFLNYHLKWVHINIMMVLSNLIIQLPIMSASYALTCLFIVILLTLKCIYITMYTNTFICNFNLTMSAASATATSHRTDHKKMPRAFVIFQAVNRTIFELNTWIFSQLILLLYD